MAFEILNLQRKCLLLLRTMFYGVSIDITPISIVFRREQFYFNKSVGN